jgi:hypothetical protein
MKLGGSSIHRMLLAVAAGAAISMIPIQAAGQTMEQVQMEMNRRWTEHERAMLRSHPERADAIRRETVEVNRIMDQGYVPIGLDRGPRLSHAPGPALRIEGPCIGFRGANPVLIRTGRGVAVDVSVGIPFSVNLGIGVNIGTDHHHGAPPFVRAVPAPMHRPDHAGQHQSHGHAQISID